MEEINDITECCICTEMFTDPRMLPCIHTFCLKCLEATRSNSAKNRADNSLPCPICRREFTIPSDGLCGLKKNFFMERLMEIAKISKPPKTTVSCDVCLINEGDTDVGVPDASKYCVECRENMCDMCSVQHKRQKLSREHQIVAFGSQLKDELVKTFVATYCNQHSREELKMYCADCAKVICMMCFAENHQMHKCSDVNKVAIVFRDEIDNFVVKVVEGSEETLARKLKLDEENRKFLEESEMSEASIKSRTDELKALIDNHASVLLDELVQRKAVRAKEVENENEEIERYLTMVNSFKSYCGELKSKGTPTDICRSVHDLRSRTEELQRAGEVMIKPNSSAVRVSFKAYTTEDILKEENFLGYLEEKHESGLTLKKNKHESSLTLKKNEELSGSISIVGRFQCATNVQAVTKLNDKIYVLGRDTNKTSGTTVWVYGEKSPYMYHSTLEIKYILRCQHVLSNEKLSCLYISDSDNGSIWKLTVDDFQVTPWLSRVGEPYTLSMANDGNLMLLRATSKWHAQLEIYKFNAKIIRCIQLPQDIINPFHIIQESNGQFIIIHSSGFFSSTGSCLLSKLNSNGEILCHFQPSDLNQELGMPFHMSVELWSNRLFVAQQVNGKFNVVMLDLDSLQWKEIVYTSEEKFQLHHDEGNEQFLVGKSKEVSIFQFH